MKIILTIIFTIIGFGILGVIFIYSGVYNVSAANKENGIMTWVLSTTSDNSVEHHAEGIKVPDLNNSAMIEEGFAHYKEMCQSCHGAPGQKETELAKGLNPPAPDLSESGKEMSAEELFWVTKNGIKMTGMPAWGKTHPDDKIWAIVAAVRRLHETSAEEYNSYPEEKEMNNSEEKSKPDNQELRYH
ncbi:MAG: cytochrome c [Ignavibacteriaceae bacterium]